MKIEKYQILFWIKETVKYLTLFGLCYSLLFFNLNFFVVLLLIIGINIAFIKFELKFHLATKLARLIRKKNLMRLLNLVCQKMQ